MKTNCKRAILPIRIGCYRYRIFSFDEHAFVIRRGEKLRIDISSSAYPYYVPHTKQKGLYSEQTTAKVACNTVVLEESYLELPIQ